MSCTIKNTSQPAHLTLIKAVNNDNGGVALGTDWTLTATGASTTITGVTGSASVTGATVKAGTYSLSESTGPAGYLPSAWVCTGGTQTGSQLALAPGETASCTITNTSQKPHLNLVKVVDNTAGGTALTTDWTLSAVGPQTLSGAGGAEGDVGAAGSYLKLIVPVPLATPQAFGVARQGVCRSGQLGAASGPELDLHHYEHGGTRHPRFD